MIEVLEAVDLRREANRQIGWIWKDFLARGMVTLLTSRWNVGKTTLISALLRQLENGGQLAGAEVAAGRAVVVSEEPAMIWGQRENLQPFGPQVSFICRPFASRPGPKEWTKLIRRLAAMPVDLVILDPLAMFLPGNAENSAAALLGALVQLHKLTDRGMAVLLLHHPRKEQSAKSLSPRGSSALTGFADFVAELEGMPNAGEGIRRRRLRVSSRLSTPPETVIELDEAGLNYSVVPPAVATDGYGAALPVLDIILGDAPTRLTRHEILYYWLEDHKKPPLPTLRRWLDRAEAEGRIEKSGTGRKYDPYKFAIAGRTDLLPELQPLETWRTKTIAHHNFILKADRLAALTEKADAALAKYQDEYGDEDADEDGDDQYEDDESEDDVDADDDEEDFCKKTLNY